MPNDILDNDRGVNAFGTPNYYIYDVNRDGTIAALPEGNTQGFVGWVLRSNSIYYHDQEDTYIYESSSSFNISTGAFAGELYDSNGFYLAPITSDTTSLTAGTYYVRFASNSDQQYTISINPYSSVNNAPVLTTPSAISTNEDTASAAITFSATDVDGDTLTYSFSDPAKGSITNNNNGTYTYMPDTNANGSDSFTITVNDGTVDVTETINVTINSVNDAPVLSQPGDPTGFENDVDASDNIFSSLVVTDDSSLATDLTYSATSSNQSLIPDDQIAFRLSSDRLFIDLDTIDNANGHATITVNVSDTEYTTTTSFVAYISPQNDAPTLTTTASLATNEDTASTDIAFSGSDVDVGDTLTYSFSDPAKGSITNNDDGTYTYTPDGNVNGSDSFMVTVNDGTVDVSQIVNVTINAVNDSPTGSPTISGTALEGETLTADTSSIGDADGLGPFSYQWRRGDDDINGATDSSYVLTSEDIGYNVSVHVMYADGDGNQESITSAATDLVETVNSEPTGTLASSVLAFSQNVEFSETISEVLSSDKAITSLNIYSKPSWLTIDTNLEISGTTPTDEFGTWNIQFEYTLDDNSLGSHAVFLNVYEQQGAKISTIGDAILVNSNTVQAQSGGQIVMLENGNYMAVWRDEVAGSNSSQTGLMGRIFDPDFNKIGGEFNISPTANNSGADATGKDLVALSDGGVVVVWSTYGRDGEVGNLRNIYAQKIDINGNLIGSHVLVNSDTPASQRDAKITELSNGNLIVTWRDFDPWTDMNSSIRGKIFDSNLQPVVNDFDIGLASNLIGISDAPALWNLEILETDSGFLSFYSISHGSVADTPEAPMLIYVSEYLNDGSLVSTKQLTTWQSSTFDEFAVEKLPTGEYLLGFKGNLVKYSKDFTELEKQVHINDLFPSLGAFVVDIKPLSDGLFLVYAYRSYDSQSQSYTNDMVTFVINSDLEAKSEFSTALHNFETWGNHTPSILETHSQDQFVALISPKYGGDYLNDLSHGDVFLQKLRVEPANEMPSGGVSFSGNLMAGDLITAYPSLDDSNGLGDLTYIWSADGEVVQSGESSSLAITDNNISKSIDLAITYTDGDGYFEIVRTNFASKVEQGNNPPTINATSSITTNEDTPTAPIAFSASDADGDTLTYSFSDPSKGSVINNGDGTYTYTPVDNANGSDSFTITVNDGTVDVSQILNVTINAVNDAPTLSADLDLILSKNDTNGVATYSATDIDGDELTVSFTSPSKGVAIDNGDSTYSYVPATDAYGKDSFDIEVSDGNLTSSQTVEVVIIEKIFNVNVAASASGSGNKYYIDGAEAPELTLKQGHIYQFDLSDPSTSNHPISFSASTSQFELDIATSGTRGVDQIITVSVPENVSGTIDYFCTLHSGMGNSLNIVEPLEITVSVIDRDGLAVHDFDILGIEQAEAEELYFDFGKTESGAFDVTLMAKPIATTENFYFQIEDHNTLSDFAFGSAVSNSGWFTENYIDATASVTTVTATGTGSGLSANVEHELASFTSSGDGLNLELTEGRLRTEIQDTVSLVADIETTDGTGVVRYNFFSSSDVLISAEEGYENAFPNDHVNELDALQLMKMLLPGSNETMNQADMIASDFNRDGKIDTMDIKAILEYTVGLPGSKVAEWALVIDDDLTGNTTSNVDYDLDITLSNLTSDISIDATTILIGDVNNSFV